MTTLGKPLIGFIASTAILTSLMVLVSQVE